MTAQTRGISTAMGNLQDGLHLIHTADAILGEMQDIIMRMRDLCVRGANQATMVTRVDPSVSKLPNPFSDTRMMMFEIMSLDTQIYKMSFSKAANGKTLLDGGFLNGQVLQIGPDNDSTHTVNIQLPDISSIAWPVVPAFPGGADSDVVTGWFLVSLTYMDGYLEIMSDARAELGAQENALNHALNDLAAQYINITGARSVIEDADFANEVTELTKNQIIGQSTLAAAAHADALSEIIYTLLDSAGLGPDGEAA